MQELLGGSGVVISRVLSPLIWVISIVTLLKTPLITTPEPPSRWCLEFKVKTETLPETLLRS